MPKARSPESPQRWAEGTESKERSLGNRVWRTELREPSLGSHGQRPGPGELCLARPAWRAELRGLCMRAEPVPNPAAPKGESHPRCTQRRVPSSLPVQEHRCSQHLPRGWAKPTGASQPPTSSCPGVGAGWDHTGSGCWGVAAALPRGGLEL